MEDEISDEEIEEDEENAMEKKMKKRRSIFVDDAAEEDEVCSIVFAFMQLDLLMSSYSYRCQYLISF